MDDKFCLRVSMQAVEKKKPGADAPGLDISCPFLADQAVALSVLGVKFGSRYFLPSSISMTGIPLRIGYL
ncbi:MAG: hypothetical protein BroJett021_24390 [Chloroflexota bacterium]|nr:MAG: hypothetical protein BroJett021_24390 [Chloroflexota bacterium]